MHVSGLQRSLSIAIVNFTNFLRRIYTSLAKTKKGEMGVTDHRWTKTVTTLRSPPGKRYRGRPCRRWDDDIKKIVGPQWIQIAQDRQR
ncbi:jg18281 [Pararge aegeria aegeria]|uniref:Jg18281 protein n=1 Tax=Pararge aegeria aegeria TaxID=348720 RepID=A0A8S4SD34_9NEOP|nr:jg18281 [Pararge aegeria aegeria]